MNGTVAIDLSSHTPHYEQLRAQLHALITTGQLGDGQRLPTVRALANDLGIAPGTVARAYRSLEAAGLVTSRRRVGTVVTSPPAALERAAVGDAALRFARIVIDHEMSDNDAHDLLAAALLKTRERAAPPKT